MDRPKNHIHHGLDITLPPRHMVLLTKHTTIIKIQSIFLNCSGTQSLYLGKKSRILKKLMSLIKLILIYFHITYINSIQLCRFKQSYHGVVFQQHIIIVVTWSFKLSLHFLPLVLGDNWISMVGVGMYLKLVQRFFNSAKISHKIIFDITLLIVLLEMRLMDVFSALCSKIRPNDMWSLDTPSKFLHGKGMC